LLDFIWAREKLPWLSVTAQAKWLLSVAEAFTWTSLMPPPWSLTTLPLTVSPVSMV